MSNFVVQFPLKTQLYQEHILDKRLEIGRQIYNALVNITQKRYKEMIKTKEYRSLEVSLTGNKKIDKPVWKQINQIRKDYNFTEYGFQIDVKKIQKHFKTNIDSHVAQKIAGALWKSYEKFFFGNGDKTHYKKCDSLNFLEGKSNVTGMMFKNDHLIWKGLNIPVQIDYGNLYENEALQYDISYCRIVRKFYRNKNKYYLQIVFKGNPPVKIDSQTGEIKHPIGKGDVGIDIGTSTIAYSNKKNVRMVELADRIQKIENKQRILLRKMDRSRRATNPNNYNADGTIRKQGNKKVKWNKSNHYLKYQEQLKELFRKQTAVRKYQHECLANDILRQGDTFYVEKMNFAGLQKRAAETTVNSSGKINKKKRFGKSLANRVPAMLLSIINRKLAYYDNQLIEINTIKARASQFIHITETYTKKKLSQRWNNFGDFKIQRDMYSAFLIMNVNGDLESFDIDKCNNRFNSFKQLHDIEVNRLKGNKNLSSIAI